MTVCYLFKNLHLILFILVPFLLSLTHQNQIPLTTPPTSKKSSPKTNQIITKSTLNALDLKITDMHGNILYPFSQQQLNQIYQCGSITNVKFQTQQIFYIFSKLPFIATLYSEDSSVKVSGYAEGIKIDKQRQNKNDQNNQNNKNNQKSQNSQQYVGLMIVNKQCQNYFSYMHYLTNLQITITANNNNSNDNKSYQNFNPIIIKIPSLTYCLDQKQLSSLQFMFDIGYAVVFCIIVSMLPTFPIGNYITQMIIFILLLVSQSNTMMQRKVFVISACFILMASNKKINYVLLQPQQLKSFKLFKSSFTSLILCYFTSVFINWNNRPHRSQIMIQSMPIIGYTIGLYVENICEMLLVIQIISCVFCINRVRNLFWWLTFTLTTYFLFPKIYTIVPNLINSLNYSQNAYFSLLLPSVFASSCQYKSLIPIIIFAPISYFIDRFNKVKFGGIVILVSYSLVSVLDDKIGIGLSLFWLIVWFIVSIGNEGQFIIITRRWLSLTQSRAIGI